MFSFIKRRFKLILIIAILAFVGVFGYQRFILAKKNDKIESAKVKRGPLEESLIISGTIEAEEKATLRFKTSGNLTWVGVKEGDYVKKYQGIASLDKRKLQKTLEKELNDYMDERWDFEQTTKDDYKDQAVTNAIKRILEKAQFDLNNTILDVEIQDLAVEYANLWTPIEGVVTYVEAPFAGVNITATQAEFEIVNPKTVYFSALADQTEVTKLHEGLTGELILDSYLDKELNGVIKTISFNPKSGETGTVYAVKFLFDDDNSDYKYRLGMTGDLNFIIQRKENILYLPAKFIKTKNGRNYVKVIKQEKEEKVYIETGMETDDEVEIVKGLEKGDVVYN